MRRLLLLGLLLPPLSLQAAPGVAPGLTLEQRLQRLERRAARITDLTLAVDALRQENGRLQGEVERLRHDLEQLRRKQRDIYADIDQRLSALRRSSAGAPVVATPDAEAASPQAAPAALSAPEVDPAQMKADYDAAYALLGPRERRYGEAAKAFAAFLEKYPGSPLAANAQYWLGEAYYVSQKNAEALAAFEALLKAYPDSPKVPGALYKIGRLRAAEGDLAAARASFEQVIRRYPDSPAADLARKQLDRLRGRRE